MAEDRRLTYRRRHRLTHVRQFRAVYEARVGKRRGPLTVYLRPNGLHHPRLGLTVGRRVGKAIVRNKMKRLLREVFRTLQFDLPRPPGGGSYDMVVRVVHNEPLSLRQCHDLVAEATEAAHRVWARRARRNRTDPDAA